MAITSCTEIFSESEWAELISDMPITTRQVEVIKHLLSGKSDKQIALAMDISIDGVRKHLTRLFLKFDLHDRHELVLYMFNHFRQGCLATGCSRWQ